MKKIKIVSTATITDKYLDIINDNFELKVGGWIKTGEFLPEEELIKLFNGAEIIIIEYEEITKNIIESLPSLRLIICTRGTPVNIDCDAAAKNHIPVLNTPGRNSNAVAEFVVSSMISIARQISCANFEVKNGRYLDDCVKDIYAPSKFDDVVWSIDQEDNPFKTYKGYEITGKTLGLIGFGSIGARVVELLSGFDMNFIAYDPYCPEDFALKHNVHLISLDDVLKQADFVSIHCKVTPETIGMIGEEQFNKMKKSSYLINTARGLIINQKDLIKSLQNGSIAGAVLDVFWREPLPQNHPLLSMRNVQITPHIAGSSYDVPSYHSRMVLDYIKRYVDGAEMINIYNKSFLK